MYRDARLTGISAVREAAQELGSIEGRAAQMFEVATAFFTKYQDEDGSAVDAVAALVVAMSRLSAVMWRGALEQRLGHRPSREELIVYLDQWELGELENDEEPL